MVATIAVATFLVAMSATTVHLARDVDRKPEPAPTPAPTSRPITYADGSTVHYGEHTVEADGPVVELDLTDDGVGFRTDDGRIWFTDGSTFNSLGAVGATGAGYGDERWPLTRPGWMLSPNAGSRLVWFELRLAPLARRGSDPRGKQQPQPAVGVVRGRRTLGPPHFGYARGRPTDVVGRRRCSWSRPSKCNRSAVRPGVRAQLPSRVCIRVAWAPAHEKH